MQDNNLFNILQYMILLTLYCNFILIVIYLSCFSLEEYYMYL